MKLLISLVAAASSAAGGSSDARTNLRGYPLINQIMSIARAETPPKRRNQSPSNVLPEFVSECVSFLLSPDSIEDGIVSQDEYTAFLDDFRCHSDGLCDGQELDFESLSLNLQLAFVRGVCPYADISKRINCIEDLETMWLDTGEFGYQVTDLEGVNGLLEDMCMLAYDNAIDILLVGAPTASPSMIVTPEPSSIGTLIATQTTEPSSVPTNEPSYSPTNPEPSKSPLETIYTIPTLTPSELADLLTASSLSTAPSYEHTPMPSKERSSSNTYFSTPSPNQVNPSNPTLENTPSVLPTNMPSTRNDFTSSYATRSPSLHPNLFNQSDNHFVTECQYFLMSPTFLEDGIVSQIELTSFLVHHCKEEGLCDDETTFLFEELDTNVQLDFVLALCPGEPDDCIDEWKETWRSGNHFGFKADAGDNLESSVHEICTSVFEYALATGIATTSAPITSAPTHAMPQSTPPSPSKMPSVRPYLGSQEGSRSKRSLVGISAALAVLFVAAGSVIAYRRSDLMMKKSVPDDYYSKEANHYGAAAYGGQWGSPSFPFSISSNSKCGSSSSSSSFRDYRFVPVFDSNGESIIQFDPNTASAVVIGSVTIGGQSSSISTGPFLRNEKSGSNSSKAYITIGQISQSSAKADAKSELSSMSSDRSTAGTPLGSSDIGSDSFSKSISSRYTMPMTQSKTKFQRHAVRFDNNVPFADWKVASRMVSDCRDPGQEAVTSLHATQRQNQFFFDLFTTPNSDSDTSTHNASLHSINITPGPGQMHMTIPTRPRHLSSTESNHSDGESSSRLPVSTNEVLLPWRPGGFSSAFHPSDGKQSEESVSSPRSSSIEPWGSNNLFVAKQASLLERAKSIWTKSITKGWLKQKQYQNLDGHLQGQEDQSVISMQSYASNIQLLPTPSSPVFGLPGLILGTFAAATIPVEVKRPSSLSLENGTEERCAGAAGSNTATALPSTTAAIHPNTAVLGIERRDIESASSELESSTGWSTSSLRHSSFSCSSNSFNQDKTPGSEPTPKKVLVTGDGDVSFIPFTTPTIDVSKTISEGDSSKESSADSKSEEINAIMSNPNNTEALDARPNVVSDSSGSSHTEENPKVLESIMGVNDIEPINPNNMYPHSSQKMHDRNFFLMLAEDIQASSSSVDHTTRTSNGDWSHNISDSTGTSDSAESSSIGTDDYGHSLSLSLESEADSASQALDWAINREISKRRSDSFNDSIISIAEE